MVVCARCTGLSVLRTATLLRFLHSTASHVCQEWSTTQGRSSQLDTTLGSFGVNMGQHPCGTLSTPCRIHVPTNWGSSKGQRGVQLNIRKVLLLFCTLSVCCSRLRKVVFNIYIFYFKAINKLLNPTAIDLLLTFDCFRMHRTSVDTYAEFSFNLQKYIMLFCVLCTVVVISFSGTVMNCFPKNIFWVLFIWNPSLFNKTLHSKLRSQMAQSAWTIFYVFSWSIF
jgi:hypothetical protein